MRKTFIFSAILISAILSDRNALAERPNIVYILADDLGYGDVRAFNAESKIATPNLDRLAASGMIFRDAHSGSAVCTPTRYGILTGRYAWRTRLKQGVLGGYSPPLIEPNRLTVAAFLKSQGYNTGAIGKWHLGLGWPLKKGDVKPGDDVEPKNKNVNIAYDQPIANGPTTYGFDEFFGISASLDMPPYIFIKNDRCVGLPTAERTYIRKGPAAPDFEAENVLPTLTKEAIAFLDRQAKSPFFLYVALASPHTPIVPTAPFKGKSGLNDYADFVMQTDDAVGQILSALTKNGQEGSTLVIFTSDNGCAPSAGYPALLKKGHNPSGPWRGTKADAFEGGHRIPFIARWPGKVPPGSKCDDTICLVDLFATCSEILGVATPENAAEDSASLLPDLLGKSNQLAREATVHHSVNGSFAIRQGDWKLILCADSGGWSEPRPGRKEVANLPKVQLYNLKNDPGETKNLQGDQPEVVARLTALLERYKSEGRSRPGK